MAPERRSDAADRLARCLRTLRRLEGLLIVDGRGLWLAARPGEIDLDGLAAWLATGDGGTPALSKALRATELRQVDDTLIGTAARQLGEIDLKTAKALVAEGHRVVSRWRTRDLAGFLETTRRRLRLLRTCLSAWPAWERALNWGAPSPSDASDLATLTEHCVTVWPGHPAARWTPPIRWAGELPRLALAPVLERILDVVPRLFSDAAAGRAAEQLLALYRPREDARAALRAALATLCDTAHALDTGQRVPAGEAAGWLRKRLVAAPGISELTEVLAAYLSKRCPDTTLETNAIAAIVAGTDWGFRRTHAARATMHAALSQFDVEEGKRRPSPELMVHCVALALSAPDFDLPAIQLSNIEGLTQLIRAAAPDDPRPLLKAFDGKVEHWWWPAVEALNEGVPVALVASVGTQTGMTVLRHLKTERSLTRWTRVRRALAERGCDTQMSQEEWFLELIRRGAGWSTQVTLATLTQVRGVERLRAIANAVSDDSIALGKTLDAWATPQVLKPPPDASQLTDLLGFDVALVDEYLHHRRLTGHGETFSAALLAPLALAEKSRAQRDWLERELTNPELPAARRRSLNKRLLRLDDPSKLRAASKRAQRRMLRAMETLRGQSLEVAMEPVIRRGLEQLMGEKLPAGPLPAGFKNALWLLRAESIDQALYTDFLRDVAAGRSLVARPPNRHWLEAAERAGLNVKAWLSGIREVVELGPLIVTIATENDPMEVLRMGSEFSTCLRLDGGENAASTVLNALDANKHVIYARKADRTIVGRKLIGVSPRGALVGFHTYASEQTADLRLAIDLACVRLAERCGLLLSNTGPPPEVLHQGFWYDDGAVAWRSGPGGASVPEGWPTDHGATAEFRVVDALGDAKQLASLLDREDAGRVLWHLLREHPDDPASIATLARLDGDQRPSGAELAALGLLKKRWFPPPDRATGEMDALRHRTAEVPPTPAAAEAMAARLKHWAAARWRGERSDYSDAELVDPPWVLSLLPLDGALAALRDHCGVQAHVIATPYRVTRFRLRMQRIFEVVLARDGCSTASLRPALKMHVSGLSALVGAMTEVPQPNAIPWLTNLRNKPRGVLPELIEAATRLARGEEPTHFEVETLLVAADKTEPDAIRVSAARVLGGSDRFLNGGATLLLALVGDIDSEELAAAAIKAAEPVGPGDYEVFAWLEWARRLPPEALPGPHPVQRNHAWEEGFRRCAAMSRHPEYYNGAVALAGRMASEWYDPGKGGLLSAIWDVLAGEDAERFAAGWVSTMALAPQLVCCLLCPPYRDLDSLNVRAQRWGMENLVHKDNASALRDALQAKNEPRGRWMLEQLSGVGA